LLILCGNDIKQDSEIRVRPTHPEPRLRPEPPCITRQGGKFWVATVVFISVYQRYGSHLTATLAREFFGEYEAQD
jgi:hypothetical protein